MASSSDLFEQNACDFSTEGTPDSDRDFWNLMSTSRRESDWGHVLLRKKSKKNKRLKIDVSSTGGSSGVNSTSSELSEALSAISAHLSLSSSSSGTRKDGTENEDEELIWKVVEDLQIETAWNEKQNESSFDAREPTREDNFMAPPAIGMEFSSEQEVLEFYQIYAKETGFSVRKGKVQRLSNGNLRKKYYFCSKEGIKQSNKKAKYKRRETRTGCHARIQCTIKDGKWVISQFFQDHNHPLSGKEAVHRQCTQKSRTPNQDSSLISTRTILDTRLLGKENAVSKLVEYEKSGMSLITE
ncbi:protein FAR1-RELATED SEQUENCE 8-like [Mercurialis annua]|uniref:protein FAR1-RELATED SEQUENCE 8-like n=1 Tax=Mercurialis annua TaxID=3986 RepID=UPI0024AF0F63|nr:protein FAR1-RELATED SEQUENCE 8-like [Mercurialis annua]